MSIVSQSSFYNEHITLTRRYFLQAGIGSAAAICAAQHSATVFAQEKLTPPPKANTTGAWPDPYFTSAEKFRDVSRGKPIPHSLSDNEKQNAGLTRETWKLEVISDPDHPAKLKHPLSVSDGTALDFESLLKLGEQHAVRFPKVMTCLNLGCPLGMGLWEGVPLRNVVWLTQPTENLRRVFYYGFHNDDPTQMFRSSLPIGRVLEDPFDLPPVILCYKLNGEWLDAERGGPVRMLVPEAYGFKSVKWLTHIVLTNLAHANDTYAEQNNDVDSPLKTFSAVLSVPQFVESGQPIPVDGYAQVGISGLSRVQVSIESADIDRADDPHFLKAPWIDAQLLGPPEQWATLSNGKIPPKTIGFNESGRPLTWPLRLTNAHWAIILPSLPPGDYKLRSRTIDEKGNAQPMPRPFRKSGHAAIETVSITVKA